eukprot:Polyplicarium_translucidae@DN1830_c0_g1_i3.p1
MSAWIACTFQDVRQRAREFAEARDWNQFHAPRNLLLALVGEVGELCEIFQWKGSVETGLVTWTAEERSRVRDELADVAVYLVRLADRCDIDLPAAIWDKMDKNDKKYPAHLSRGRSNKYTDYEPSSKCTECQNATAASSRLQPPSVPPTRPTWRLHEYIRAGVIVAAYAAACVVIWRVPKDATGSV